jgi:MFS family permease
MNDAAKAVQRTYLVLTLFSTLAASFIWGINTLFLLDAGLSNTEAFAANAFFTAGQVLFEVPTGVVADTWGRRTSYLLGAVTLIFSTLLYLAMWKIHAPFWAWALSSMLLGLGFTFFSGATEAWLADALAFSGAADELDAVLARAQIVYGAAMLTGSVAGGFVAQLTNLGVPYLIRCALLVLTFAAAAWSMRDIGFTPQPGNGLADRVRSVVHASFASGLRNPPVRWLMLAGTFSGAVGMFAFYALQPYLLHLYGDEHAFGLAGIVAALVAGTQIVAGLVVPWLRRVFALRTHVLLVAALITTVCLVAMGSISSLGVAVPIVLVWSFSFWIGVPVREAYLNGLIPSAQRATVLSFDNLMNSAGGALAQPMLGRVADARGYAAAYWVCGAIQLAALPFLALARREHAASDPMTARARDALKPT